VFSAAGRGGVIDGDDDAYDDDGDDGDDDAYDACGDDAYDDDGWWLAGLMPAPDPRLVAELWKPAAKQGAAATLAGAVAALHSRWRAAPWRLVSVQACGLGSLDTCVGV
jgi:hypothetical protein